MARERLGLATDHDNWLIELVLRDWTASIPRDQANAIYGAIYAAVHQGQAGRGYHQAPG